MSRKDFLLLVLRALALPLALIPGSWRVGFIKGLVVLDSRIGEPAGALRRGFRILDMMDRVIAERATAYGGGIHPKHHLTGYHDFFVENIPHGSRVLDVGCGYGAVARSIAERVEGAHVTGIDLDERNIRQARERRTPPNLGFVCGDATRSLPEGAWDVLVLSNVLEHIERRIPFLRGLVAQSGARLVLIRVPLYQRHWHVPLREELGLSYFSDPTHFIEHTMAEFLQETAESGLSTVEMNTRWGEIWAVCRPAASVGGAPREPADSTGRPPVGSGENAG